MSHLTLAPVETTITPVRTVVSCPLNHGVATLDHLLAELMGDADSAAFDAALDLRWLLAHSDDANAMVSEFFRLRALIEERHYLACFRLRRWLESQLVAWVSETRHSPAVCTELKLAGCVESVRASCIRLALEGAPTTPWTRVRFAFSRTAAIGA
ncbi:hypothetical protein [Oleiharenicola lentus]|uniref:hypothetical protein n=1 Tax=Oleiharenicola lentus TaxID=2508720 RepID=UPI003F669B23